MKLRDDRRHAAQPGKAALLKGLFCLVAALSACGGNESDSGTPGPLAAAAGHASQAAASPQRALPPGAAEEPAVLYADGRLTVHSSRGDARSIVAAIEQQARISVLLVPAIGSPALAGDVADAPLVDGLLALLRNYDLDFSFRAAGAAPAALYTVQVYPKGEGPRRPYAAPAGRPDAFAREVAAPADELAHRGTDQAADPTVLASALASTDPRLRRQALSRSLDLGVALPEGMLQQLAADADPAARRLALTALAREPALQSPVARSAAQGALQDGDPAVREQAKDMLEQMDLAALPSDAIAVPQQTPLPP